jgi:hypothetical protein
LFSHSIGAATQKTIVPSISVCDSVALLNIQGVGVFFGKIFLSWHPRHQCAAVWGARKGMPLFPNANAKPNDSKNLAACISLTSGRGKWKSHPERIFRMSQLKNHLPKCPRRSESFSSLATFFACWRVAFGVRALEVGSAIFPTVGWGRIWSSRCLLVVPRAHSSPKLFAFQVGLDGQGHSSNASRQTLPSQQH